MGCKFALSFSVGLAPFCAALYHPELSKSSCVDCTKGSLPALRSYLEAYVPVLNRAKDTYAPKTTASDVLLIGWYLLIH